MLKPICSPRTGDQLSTSVTPIYTRKANLISITSYPNRLKLVPSPIMSPQHTTYYMRNSDMHSSWFASSALDFLTLADDYVPALPLSIITSSFSSDYVDNCKDEDSSSESRSSQSLLRQNNQKHIKRKSQKADEKYIP